MHTNQTYKLGKIKQLIDLNGDSINFDISFSVKCKDSTPFNLLVVDQETLDNEDLVYKDAKHSISGNIVADKNIYQNHFLILKSDTPCDVEVEIKKIDLPETPDIRTSGRAQPSDIRSDIRSDLRSDLRSDNKFKNRPDQLVDHNNKIRNTKNEVQSTPKTNWKKISVIAIVMRAGIAFLVYLYKQPPVLNTLSPMSIYDLQSNQHKSILQSNPHSIIQSNPHSIIQSNPQSILQSDTQSILQSDTQSILQSDTQNVASNFKFSDNRYRPTIHSDSLFSRLKTNANLTGVNI